MHMMKLRILGCQSWRVPTDNLELPVPQSPGGARTACLPSLSESEGLLWGKEGCPGVSGISGVNDIGKPGAACSLIWLSSVSDLKLAPFPGHMALNKVFWAENELPGARNQIRSLGPSVLEVSIWNDVRNAFLFF